MTATVSRGEETADTPYTVEPLRDPDEIRTILQADRPYAAYALAQLDPQMFKRNEWYRASGPSGTALVLHSRSGIGRALFAVGDPQALDAALKLHPGPRFAFGSLYPEHLPIIERYFVVTRPQTMHRMSITTERFQPVDGPARRLRGRDAPAVNRLYSVEAGPTAYRQNHLEEGVYYGVEADGRLVSIAGTHVASPAEGVAVVGNVFTHPRYRSGGLATATTSAVTQEVLQSCDLVVLTVEEDNEHALRVYDRLGYVTECTIHETPLIRKDPFGLSSLLRRMIAGWRGRGQRKEVLPG
ncbi:MAG: GNAT family N-acetyltransferase [Chloroflexi bacterium]|nr:GNAT family N-acetyltransferase [Chloroflexota bacterium]